ncbi:60Kd inner membrane protein-domain-containing protein [Dipodascopsis uninucleata]
MNVIRKQAYLGVSLARRGPNVTSPNGLVFGSAFGGSAACSTRILISKIADSKRFNSSEAANSAVNQLADAAQAVQTATEIVSSSQLGYLESIGIANSWYWPPGLCAHVLEMAHVYTGLPWWGTIVLVGLASRLIFLPLSFKAFVMNTRMKQIKPQLDRVTEQYKTAISSADRSKFMLRRKRLLEMHDVKLRYMATPALNIPVAYGMFVALNRMASYPIDGFMNQGALWFQSLADTDPFLGLSAISAVSFYGVTKLGGESGGVSTMTPVMRNVMLYVPSLAMLGMGFSFSAANVLFFATTGVATLAQTAFMRTKYFKNMMGLDDSITVAPSITSTSESDGPKMTIREQYRKAVQDAKRRAEMEAARSKAPEPTVISTNTLPVRLNTKTIKPKTTKSKKK